MAPHNDISFKSDCILYFVTGVVFLVAVLPMPYEYYDCLGLYLFIVCILSAYRAFHEKQRPLYFPIVFLTVLFFYWFISFSYYQYVSWLLVDIVISLIFLGFTYYEYNRAKNWRLQINNTDSVQVNNTLDVPIRHNFKTYVCTVKWNHSRYDWEILSVKYINGINVDTGASSLEFELLRKIKNDPAIQFQLISILRPDESGLIKDTYFKLVSSYEMGFVWGIFAVLGLVSFWVYVIISHQLPLLEETSYVVLSFVPLSAFLFQGKLTNQAEKLVEFMGY